MNNFTFQSGDIQIEDGRILSLYHSLFTFQSGDIQIYRMLDNFSSSYLLYIPIWWYSNKKIQQLQKWRKMSLHSNLVIFKFSSLWIWISAISNFTFQSGDIQITFLSCPSNSSCIFTFQSGDIQILVNPFFKNFLL